MPNTREKLIELLAESEHMSYEKKADHLIANGVRLEEKQATSEETSKWISASDPPNKMKPVICLYKNEDGTQVGGGYVNDHGI